jgi:hypothetical protein
MYSASSGLRGLGVLSDTAALINYLIAGFVSRLKIIVRDDINLYSSVTLDRIVRDGVTAAVNDAAASSSNQLITRELMSQLAIRFRDRYPGGNPHLFVFGNTAQRNEGIRHLNNITEAVRYLSDELLAAWIPASPVTGNGSSAAPVVNVDTARSQEVVDQNRAAAGLPTGSSSFLNQYGIYIAAGLVLLLLISKGK